MEFPVGLTLKVINLPRKEPFLLERGGVVGLPVSPLLQHTQIKIG